MTLNGWVQIVLYCAIITALVKPMGGYMAHVFAGERTLLGALLAPAAFQTFATATQRLMNCLG